MSSGFEKYFAEQRRSYGACAFWTTNGDGRFGTLAQCIGVVVCWHLLLRTVVLAAAAMVGLPRRSRWRGAFAVAGRDSIRSWFCGRAEMRLGFWMDRPGYAGAIYPATAFGCRRVLSLCAESDVRRFHHRLVRTLDRVRPRQSWPDRCSCGPHA